MVLHINYWFNEYDISTNMYNISKQQLEDAQNCVSHAFECWKKDGGDPGKTLDEYIEAEFKKKGVVYSIVDYETIDLDCTGI